jgi:hypothetical protein
VVSVAQIRYDDAYAGLKKGPASFPRERRSTRRVAWSRSEHFSLSRTARKGAWLRHWEWLLARQITFTVA